MLIKSARVQYQPAFPGMATEIRGAVFFLSFFVGVVVAFSSYAKIMGEGKTNHSLPVPFKRRLAHTQQYHSFRLRINVQ